MHIADPVLYDTNTYPALLRYPGNDLEMLSPPTGEVFCASLGMCDLGFFFDAGGPCRHCSKCDKPAHSMCMLLGVCKCCALIPGHLEEKADTDIELKEARATVIADYLKNLNAVYR